MDAWEIKGYNYKAAMEFISALHLVYVALNILFMNVQSKVQRKTAPSIRKGIFVFIGMKKFHTVISKFVIIKYDFIFP